MERRRQRAAPDRPGRAVPARTSDEGSGTEAEMRVMGHLAVAGIRLRRSNCCRRSRPRETEPPPPSPPAAVPSLPPPPPE